VLLARVAALAVHDHARREHEAAVEAARGQGPQQLCGREVVVADVGGQVAEIDAQADHRRLVADMGHARGRPRGDHGVAQIALQQLGGGIEVAGPLAVRGGQERVEHADLLPRLEQRVDDVRADEAGASGDQDHDPLCNPLVAFRA
jgi:hypothetical protein